MQSLIHNGIIVVGLPEARGLTIRVRGRPIKMDQLQEAMAVAWVKKLGTPYVEDPVFVSNFMQDFSKALGFNPPLSIDEVDFSEVIAVVEAERARKAAMTEEERRAEREARRAERERLKEKYGYAIVDGVRMELANYQTEPPGIFMGRGEHPLRGRWKPGVTHKDITLNLSPDSPRPPGEWGEIVWAPDCLWIAKWTDALTGKLKYVWLHDSTPPKQAREAAKFDKALRMEPKLPEIRQHIMDGLRSEKPRIREVAAACYLIDRLSLRVGDEKDPDEADTVGATTLRVEHLTLKKNNTVVFDFLGKDSVPWHKELQMPPDVFAVFKELYDRAAARLESFLRREAETTSADPKKVAQIFPSIGSSSVNRFLSQVDPDLTAKVFRTLHASVTMRDELAHSNARQDDPDFIKKAAFRRANLEVARLMNHTKQAPKNWERTVERYRERLRKADERVERAKAKVTEAEERLETTKAKIKLAREKRHARLETLRAKVEELRAALATAEDAVKAAQQALKEAQAEAMAASPHSDGVHQMGGKKRSSRRSSRDPLSRFKKEVDRANTRVRRLKGQLRRARKRLKDARGREITSKEREAERLSRARKAVDTAKKRLKNAKLARRKVKVDFELAKACRTWNLGTSLKSYIHPRIVYRWCQEVDYDWRKVYPKTLQRKFEGWIAG